MTPPTTRYARSGDVNIAYQVVGDGPFDLVMNWGWISHIELIWEDPELTDLVTRLHPHPLVCSYLEAAAAYLPVKVIPNRP